MDTKTTEIKKLKAELEKFKSMYHRDVIKLRRVELKNRELKREVSRLKQNEQQLTSRLKRG